MTGILAADHRAVLAAFARHDVSYVLVGSGGVWPPLRRPAATFGAT